ncbi:MAG: LacI family DNA-binding transcriptional regulator [Propionicimonas sp.]|uniref:LacI family DNA-binding transcriptional regulator n=1 Tax=Propionicimonas sp. TaxID=1955623 RepID=UPI002B1EB6F2|nr:LacI family DNA-binding transcriptional regulator [Propionicimonas sp.]MEA4943608.1 LacI family DNA-binding transcriptional regulator [Propionicimonas sp.]MEA5116773.1 LacI family DNA-binding transcriptional regulator [Propionicimonas sp.]
MTSTRGSRAPKPRLRDIADVAKVSTATVSRVLNDKPGASDEVREAVLAAMDMLGYERPAILRAKAQGLVGVVLPELVNPVFGWFAQSLESRLAARGYTALLCTQSPGGTTEQQCVDMLLGQSVSGIIFVSGLHADAIADHQHYLDLAARGIAATYINGFAPEIDGTFISVDDGSAMDASVKHLVSLGHSRIGLAIGPDRFVPSRSKIDAFRNALQQHLGIEDAAGHISPTLYTVEGGHAASAALIESGHTAIICGSDLMALGAIRAARSAGLDVPDDLSVVGYDDSSLIAFTDPPLTTIHQPVTQMSAAAVATLIDELDGHPGPRTDLLFRAELIVRGSTGTAPAREHK